MAAVSLHAHRAALGFVAQHLIHQLAGHVASFLHGEQCGLIGIAADRQDDGVEQAAGTAKHVQMPQGYGIK